MCTKLDSAEYVANAEDIEILEQFGDYKEIWDISRKMVPQGTEDEERLIARRFINRLISNEIRAKLLTCVNEALNNKCRVVAECSPIECLALASKAEELNYKNILMRLLSIGILSVKIPAGTLVIDH